MHLMHTLHCGHQTWRHRARPPRHLKIVTYEGRPKSLWELHKHDMLALQVGRFAQQVTATVRTTFAYVNAAVLPAITA